MKGIRKVRFEIDFTNLESDAKKMSKMFCVHTVLLSTIERLAKKMASRI